MWNRWKLKYLFTRVKKILNKKIPPTDNVPESLAAVPHWTAILNDINMVIKTLYSKLLILLILSLFKNS